jgi:ATP-binding cassette, subfamily C, bacterial
LPSLFSPSTVRFVAYFFRAYPGRTAIMIGLLILAGVAEGVGLVTLLPLLEIALGEGERTSTLTRAVVDILESVGLAPELGTLLAVIVVMMTLKAVAVWFAMRQVGYTVTQVATDLRLRLIRAVLKARWRFFSGQPSGHFINALGTEASRASSGYQSACQAVAGVIQIAIYLVLVFLMSWQVAVAAFIVAPVVLYALKGFVEMSRQAGSEQTTLKKALIARVTELLPGIKAIKAMAREAMVLPLLEKETEGFNRAKKRSILASESLKAFQEPLIVLVLALGLYATMTWTEIPTAAVLVSAVLFYRVLIISGRLQGQYQSITDKESAFWSMMGTLEEAATQAEPTETGKEPAPELNEEISLEDVWFSYDGEPVLRGVDLRIPARELVALAGVSGAGKTTLVDLVTGLLRPDRGVIRVDGVLLSEIDRRDWRSRIGYVPQEMLLFHDTILRNVTLGDDRFDRGDVERALRAAGAWDFVQAHPAGMDRIVGERGSQLSGGQRQRIGIARALVSRPRLLILDEATTGLDPDTEAEVCGTLVQLRGETTIVAISHQAAIRTVADRVYEVREGVAFPLGDGSDRSRDELTTPAGGVGARTGSPE